MYNFDSLNKFSNKLGSNIAKPLNKHMKHLSKPIKSFNKIISKNINKLPFKLSPLSLFILLLILLLVICVVLSRTKTTEGFFLFPTNVGECGKGSSAAADNISRIEKFKEKYGSINPVNYSNNDMKDKFKNYYVFSSLNSAAGPNYDGQGTDECMNIANLRGVLGMGARLVDFEVFHSSEKGLVFKAGKGPNSVGKYNASSGTSNYLQPSHVFPELLKAVSRGNRFHTDPLIVNFRIQMTNKDAMVEVFSMLRSSVEAFFLGRKNFDGKPVLLDTPYRWNGKGPTQQQKLFEQRLLTKEKEVVPKKVFDLAIERGIRNMISGFTKDKEVVEIFEKETIPEAVEQLKSQGHCYNKIENLEEKKNMKNMLCVDNLLGYFDTTIEYPVPPAVNGYIGPLTYEGKTYSTFKDVCPDFCSVKKEPENLEVVYGSVLDAPLNELSGKIIICLHIDNKNVSPTVFKVDSTDNAFFKYVNILGGDTATLKNHNQYKDEMTKALKTIPKLSKQKYLFSMMKPGGLKPTPNPDCFVQMLEPAKTGNAHVDNMGVPLTQKDTLDESKLFCEHKLGVQALMMKFYSSDNKDPFEHYYKFFAKKGSAFVLKPKDLREVPIPLKKIPDQNPNVNAAAVLEPAKTGNAFVDNMGGVPLTQKDTAGVLKTSPN